ncbi:MAG TPA: hypothetical protein VGZ02_06095 [Candidatus Baltobacteraceae bacterium]|jgi:hypothetical protein|nr:hypothetical protein [Candidatus Baltobacteraceae bacterium]
MSKWHVWGDYIHTIPQRIGAAQLTDRDDPAARRAADAKGFDIERRTRNGFEPWAATYSAEEDDGLEFAFASFPTVRGWERA